MEDPWEEDRVKSLKDAGKGGDDGKREKYMISLWKKKARAKF